MIDLSDYPYHSYEPNRVGAAFVATITFILLIGFLIQSILARFDPRRPMVLILVSQLMIAIESILRSVLSSEEHKSRTGFTAMSTLWAIGLRSIILSNYDFLTHITTLKTSLSRTIIIGSILIIILSMCLTIPAGTLSFNNDTIDKSFQLRQASNAIILFMTILFYPIWLITKTIHQMTNQAIILLIISSFNCVIIALYLVITSSHNNYIAVNKQEFWYYLFQILPIIIIQITWTVLHPIRSLKNERK